MIVRVVLALLVAPVLLLWLVLAVGYAHGIGETSDLAAELLGGQYGNCSSELADVIELPIALAGLAAAVFAILGRRRRLAAACSLGLLVVWLAVVVVGECGIGTDDGGFDTGVIPSRPSLELRASPSRPSTPRIPQSPRATG